MEEQQQPTEEMVVSEPRWTDEDRSVFKWSLAGTSAVMLGADVIAHWGVTGLLFGLPAAFLLSQSAPNMYKEVKEFLPWTEVQEVVSQAVNHREAGSRSLLDRAMGRNYEGKPKDEPAGQPKQGTPEDEQETAMYNPAIHRDHFYFGDTLFPHADRILSGRKAIFGVSDAGKSNNIAVICEELGRFGLLSPDLCIPIVYFDSEDEARGLCSKRYFRNPCWMDAQTLTVQNAFEFAQRVMNERLQVVVNLQSYEDVDAALVMFSLIRGIQYWEEALPNDDRIPCEVILDEAAVWLPQNSSESSLSKAMVEDPEGQPDGEGNIPPVSVLSLLHRIFFSMVVRRGRKRGIGFTLATQRIAEIDKRALQANYLILMRQTMTADFAVYKKYGIEANEAAALKPGQAYVFSSQEVKSLHQFRRRQSPSGAKTPGLGNLRKAIKHPIEIEEAENIDAIIASMPDIDPTDSRYESSLGIRRSPFYEQTAYPYNAQTLVNPSVNMGASIYRDVTLSPPFNGGINDPVNGATSRLNRQEQASNFHLINGTVNNSPEREKASGGTSSINVNEGVDTSSVSAEKRETIKRLVEMGAMKHALIAKAVKLDGPKYAIYKQVCAEEGIEIK